MRLLYLNILKLKAGTFQMISLILDGLYGGAARSHSRFTLLTDTPAFSDERAPDVGMASLDG